MCGRNVCFLGAAGSAKSEAARLVADTLERITWRPVIRCGTTGLAGANIDGFTMHKMLGLTADEPVFNMPASAVDASPKFWYHRWNEHTQQQESVPACAVVLDEISMARRDAFDIVAQRMESINRTLMLGINENALDEQHQPKYFPEQAKKMLLQYRNRSEMIASDVLSGPYLPCPLIVFGDFKQLPPVVDDEGEHNQSDLLAEFYSRYDLDPHSNYAFMGRYWSRMDFAYIVVDEPVRASDEKYAQIEMAMHDGDFSAGYELEHLMAKRLPNEAVRLYTANKDAIAWNNKRLQTKSDAGLVRCAHKDPVRVIRPLADGKRGDFGWTPKQPDVARVAYETPVMITANAKCIQGAPPAYYNGSTGRVLEFSRCDQLDKSCHRHCVDKHFGSALVQLNNDDERCVWVKFSEYDKRAVSMKICTVWKWIRKHNYERYISGEYSLSDIYKLVNKGQLYGIHPDDIDDLTNNFSKYHRVYNIVNGLEKNPPSAVYITTAIHLFMPLRPMDAFTIHKAQGQTFDMMWVESTALNSAGATYTALTRCHEARDLHISMVGRGIDWHSIKYDYAIDDFYRNIVKRNLAQLDRLDWPRDWLERIDASYHNEHMRFTFFEGVIDEQGEWSIE